MSRPSGFWGDYVEDLRRDAVELLTAAGQPVDRSTILDLVASASRSRAQAADPLWQARSYCHRCLVLADTRLGPGDPRRRSIALRTERIHSYYAERHPSVREALEVMLAPILDGP